MCLRRLVFACILLLGTGATAETVVLDLPTNDLLYDPFTGVIYATIPGRAGALGNTVTVIDPLTGSLGPSVFVGSEPNAMALSDDGRFLYVGLDGAAAVRLVDLESFTAGLQFGLGGDPFFGPYYPEDIEVQPGNPDVVAISRRLLGVSPRHGGVGIYDSGVPRPLTTPDHTGSNVIEFSSDPSTLYGYNNETTEFGFRTMLVDADGVTTLQVADSLITGFSVDIDHVDGAIFATTGVVLDPASLLLLGTYPGVGFASSLVAAPDLDRTYFLAGNDLHGYRLSTFTFVHTETFASVVGTGDDLIRWGAEGLAFRTTGDQVFLLQSAFPDSDGDGLADFTDNCPDLFNPGQEDRDFDGVGDACDPFPDRPDDLLMCLEQRQADALLIEQLEDENAMLLELLADGDTDGVLDATDRCPETRAGKPVDLAGCSLRQFCGRWQRPRICRAADWRNNEPLGARDCSWRRRRCLPPRR